jgi:signal transduction histidine kinase
VKKTQAFFLLLYGIASTLFASGRIDSALQSMVNLSDSNRIDSMVRISRLRSMAGDGKGGLAYAQWALQRAEEKNYTDLLPKARFYVAQGYDELGQLDSVIYHYKRCLEELKGSRVAFWNRYVYDNLGYIYRQLGNYEKALDTQLKGLKIFEREVDSIYLARYYTNIGYTYDRMKEYRKAIEWQNRCLAILPEGNDFIKFLSIGRKAIAYDDLEFYDSAHYYNQIALRYNETVGDSAGIGSVCSNIANTYIKQEQWEKALHYAQRACRMSLVGIDRGNKAISHINLGNVLRQLGRYQEAAKALKQGEKFARQWSGVKFQSEAYYRQYELYKTQGKYDSALHYYQQFKKLEDSLYGLEKIKQVNELSTRYETEKKEHQLEIQALNLEEQRLQLQVRRRQIIVLLLSVLLLIALGIYSYQRYKARKEAELQQRIIEEQERGLEAVFHAQEEERKRIAKDLHDGIGQQLSGVKMAFQKLSKRLQGVLPEREGEIRQLTKVISETADEVRSISHQMMPRALLELGLVEALEDMLSKSLAINNIRYDFEHHGIEQRLSEQKEVSLYRISQELINNIIKHSEATQVNVHLFKNKDKIILIIEDNGKGMGEVDSEGHGLMNIKSRLNTLNGEVNLEPSPFSGTLATIRIPAD